MFDGNPERLPHFPGKEEALDRIHDEKKRIRSRRNEQGHVSAISFVIHQHGYKEDKRLIHRIIELRREIHIHRNIS